MCECVLCLFAHTDWSQRCVSRVSDGVWETIVELFTCSPWITYISIITLFHTAWATVTLSQQLYQVYTNTSRLGTITDTRTSAPADSNSERIGFHSRFLSVLYPKHLNGNISSDHALCIFMLIDCISWTDDFRKSEFAAWTWETPTHLLSQAEPFQVITLHLQRQFQ